MKKIIERITAEPRPGARTRGRRESNDDGESDRKRRDSSPIPQAAVAVEMGREVLIFSPAEIRDNARRFGPSGPLVLLWLRRRHLEGALFRNKQVRFRLRDTDSVCQAYRSMDAVEFSGINLLQAWSNWRTIPRNLSGRLPARPVAVVDLCCGIGESTEVLAFYCPPGSQILGLEVSSEFVETARCRRFSRRDGDPAEVTFNAQSVLDPFCDAEGERLAEQSIDLVNACGAIGCHFDPKATTIIAAECARVLRPGGLAMLDSGRDGTRPDDMRRIMDRSGFVYLGRARSHPFDRLWQLCFRRHGGGTGHHARVD